MIDGRVILRLALGEIDHLRLVSLGVEPDALGLAAGARQDVVGVGFGLVAGALLVGAGALHVIEGVDDGRRRIDPRQLHLHDANARALAVEQVLQQRLGLLGDFAALVGERRLNRRVADDLAQRAPRCDMQGRIGIGDLEQILSGVLDLPQQRAIGLDDILVPGQHLLVARLVDGAIEADAELHLPNLGDFWEKRGLERPGQMKMQAGRRRVDPGAETQHHALFVGLHLVKAGR